MKIAKNQEEKENLQKIHETEISDLIQKLLDAVETSSCSILWDFFVFLWQSSMDKRFSVHLVKCWDENASVCADAYRSECTQSSATESRLNCLWFSNWSDIHRFYGQFVNILQSQTEFLIDLINSYFQDCIPLCFFCESLTCVVWIVAV